MTRIFIRNRKQGRQYSRGPVSRPHARPRLSGNEIINAILSSQQAQKPTAVEEAYAPAHQTFAQFPISDLLKKNILDKGYTSPTPIQDKTIPSILEGRDVIGIANTGTGKTAAFLIPLIEMILNNRSEKVLIIAPTRELAVQIFDEFRMFARGMRIYATLCIGGSSIGRQQSELRQQPNLVIGTPGRIKDLIETKSLSLSNFSKVVLDEADRMVDIGFISDIKYFISLLPKKRQSLFFSATISGKVSEILQAFVTNPVTVSVKKQETTAQVEQQLIHVENGGKKIDKLHDLLIQPGFDKVLVFGRTKWGIQKLTEELIKRGFKVGAIHGNKSQNQRLRVLQDFKNSSITILLATDVASRGLDIEDVTHVINYELPESYDDYVHRIGRTGRANKKGIALTFV